MDTRYQPIYRQAAAMQNRFHNYTQTMAHDPAATALRTQIHGLTNDLATSKKTQLVQKRLTNIQNQLRRASYTTSAVMSGQSPLLNTAQSRLLRSSFEQMRQSIIQHPKF